MNHLKIAAKTKIAVWICLWAIEIILSSVGHAQSGGSVPQYELLANRRAQIQLPPYTPAQRQLVADQLKLEVEDMYTNIEIKLKAYGPGVDSRPEINEIDSQAAQMSDNDLHSQLAESLERFRDFHLRYLQPKPLSCYQSLIPVSFDTVGSRYFVRTIVTNPGIVALVPQLSQIHLGDELIRYGGISPLAATAAHEAMGFGSNPAERMRRARQLLSFINNVIYPLPDGDSVLLSMKTSDGKAYDIELPWISVANLSCLGVSNASAISVPEVTAARTGAGESALDESEKSFLTYFNPLKNQEARQKRRGSANSSSVDLSNLMATNEPTINYKVLSTSSGDFGYINISAMQPTAMDDAGAWALIENLLQNQFKSTQGLIVDVRSNPGGIISYGERMVQFFNSSTVESLGFRIKVTATNQYLLQNSDFLPSLLASFQDAQKKGEEFSAPIPITTPARNNSFGQVYFAPVIVLTDSMCFSTCDMFAASVQDHGAALVVGVDTNTGGGGANNYLHSALMLIAPGPSSPLLPFPDGQDMSVAFRQGIRTGLHQGQFIEDVGAASDMVIPITRHDMSTFDSDLVGKLINQLRELAYAKPLGSLWLDHAVYDLAAGQKLTVQAESNGLNYLEFRLNGKTIATQQIQSSPQTLTIPSANLTRPNGSLEVIGWNFSGQASVRRIIDYRFTGTWVTPPFVMNMSAKELTPLTAYSWPTGRDSWGLHSGKIGFAGPDYVDSSDADMSLLLDLSQASAPLALNINMSLMSETGSDTLEILAYQGETQVATLQKLMSGNIPAKNYSYDLSPFIGQKVELRFVFFSNGTLQPGIGPIINSLSIQ